MKGVNKVFLLGNLGKDPEVHNGQDGKIFAANISLATGYSVKNKEGQYEEKTEWHRVVFFGRLAEIADQYLRKGAQIYVEGRLQTRKWQDQNGVERYMTEIIASELKMLSTRQQDASPTEQFGAPHYDDDVSF